MVWYELEPANQLVRIIQLVMRKNVTKFFLRRNLKKTFKPSKNNQLKNQTRRERLKSALYLRLKKRKTFFWKKT